MINRKYIVLMFLLITLISSTSLCNTAVVLGNVHARISLERVVCLANYIKENSDKKFDTIVFSGKGKGLYLKEQKKYVSEAEFMSYHFLKIIPNYSGNIVIENKSMSTMENASMCTSLVENGESITIVTHKNHIERATRNFEKFANGQHDILQITCPYKK